MIGYQQESDDTAILADRLSVQESVGPILAISLYQQAGLWRKVGANSPEPLTRNSA